MPKTVTVTLVDDIDGTCADETVTFSFDGARYESDVATDNADKLCAQLNTCAAAGRTQDKSLSHGARNVLRQWGRRHGHDVAERGQLPVYLVDAFAEFEAANHVVIGVVAVGGPKDLEPFDASYLGLVREFADQAAIALTLAAARELDHERELTRAAERVAKDLHDHVIQPLFAAGLGLATIAQAASSDVTNRLSQSVDDLQAIVDDIRVTIYRLQLPVERAGDYRQRIEHVVAGLRVAL
jgi:signal transduction histidine kinase